MTYLPPDSSPESDAAITEAVERMRFELRDLRIEQKIAALDMLAAWIAYEEKGHRPPSERDQ